MLFKRLILLIAIIVGISNGEAKKSYSSSGSTLTASMLITRSQGYVGFSDRCQTNLKRAGFTLVYSRPVQLHDIDDDYNDILVNGIEKNYSKGGILVRLCYLSAHHEAPCSIEIEFPNQNTKYSFMKTLPKLGFKGNGDSYIAHGCGCVVDAQGNTVSIGYLL